MQPPRVSPSAIRFGLFEADLSAGELRKRGRKISLQDQPFRVLALLLQHPGELVTRDELQQALWPADTFGDFDEGLNKAIQKLRQALDDSSENPRFIETLPRKGYRFIAPVERPSGEESGAAAKSAAVEGKATSPATEEPVKRRNAELLAWVMFGIVSAALLVFVGVYFWVLRPAPRPGLRVVPLTTFPGRQRDPALSPDGNQVAFAWDGEQGGNSEIYVKLMDAGPPLRLTTSSAANVSPTWSPDAQHIAFCRELPDRSEIWMVRALGGGERKLGEVTALTEYWVGCGLSWSPDGKYIAVMDKNAPRDPYGISLLSVETGAKHKVTSPPPGYTGDYHPRFSPDGKTLAFVRDSSLRGAIYILPLTSGGTARGEPRRLIDEQRIIFRLDWTSDGRRIMYSSGQFAVGSANLFAIPSSGGAPERIAVPDANPTSVSISRRSNRLVYQRDLWDHNIWRIPGPNSSGKASAPIRFIASTEPDQEPQYSPDGTRVVFTSARSGNYEVWVCDQEGRNPVQLTSFGGAYLGSPRWSMDSRWIAFDNSKGGNWDIYVISADGGQPRRLTGGWRPSWSHDGRWIYFCSQRSGDMQIWKAPAHGGAAVQVTKRGGFEAFEAADGKILYYVKSVAAGIWKVPVDGGEETRVVDRIGVGRWALTSEGICFFDLPDSKGTPLKFHSFETGKLTLLREFSRDTQVNTGGDTALTVSPDGHWVLYTQRDQSASNLMLVENFR